MLIIVCEVTDVYIEVNSFMIRRLVSEAEAIRTSLLNHKLQLLARLVVYFVNLFAGRSLYLRMSEHSWVKSSFCNEKMNNSMQENT